MIHFSLRSAVEALLGGSLIGAAAALYLHTNGKIAGISSIAGSVFKTDSARFTKLAFLCGLLIAGFIWAVARPEAFGQPVASLPLLLGGGFLVGLGSGIGGGCTSGHGVCGISRGSTRSIVATVVFMGTAIATNYALRHI